MSLATTFAAISGRNSGVHLSYNIPAVNMSAEVVVNNSIACFFNSSGCVPGRLIQFVHASSGFGTSALQQLQLSVVQGGAPARNCDNTSWLSDSSMYCLFSAALSPEFIQLRIVVGTTGAHLFVKNPSYIQAPPPLNNETVKIRIYKNARYPEGEDRGFREFGATTNFVFGESSFFDNVQHSEVVNFGVLVFLDAPQYFLDANFLPIETSISANLTVWNASDVTSLITCDASSSKHLFFSLPSRQFWGKVCTVMGILSSRGVHQHAIQLARNCAHSKFEWKFVFDLPVLRHSLLILPERLRSLSQEIFDQIWMLRGCTMTMPFGFRFLYGNSLDRMCESGGRSRFKYSIVLICQGKISAFRRSCRY
jgi:hypothetical protein